MTRCYLPPERWGEQPVRISGRQAYHLIRVLRVRSGDSLSCFDGRGREAEATVRRVSGLDLLLEIGPERTVPPLQWALTLGVAIPKPARMEQIIDEATQLGVYEILPLATERSVRGDVSSSRQARWAQIAIEAGKQSGSTRLPEIRPVQPFKSLLTSLKGYDLCLIAALQGPHERLEGLLASGPNRILLLIGPEGDFTSEELNQALRAGARPFSLGPTVLRCETAALSALSIIFFLLREKTDLGGKGKFFPCHP